LGKANLAVNQLLARKPVFADLINGILHQGRQVLRAEHLEPAYPHTGAMLLDSEGKKKALERVGDIRMHADGTSYSVLFSEETQAGVHYAMPVRTMLDTVLEYLRQVQAIEKMHKEQGHKLQGDELLSGITRHDKLTPVVNLVFFLGDHWDGSRSLYDMLAIDWNEPEARELQRYIPDFPINLICAKDIQHPEHFKTCLQHIFTMLKYNHDKKKLYDYIRTHRDELNQMDQIENMATMVLLGMQKKVEELMEQNVVEKEINMCKAIEDMIKDGEARGKAQGENRFVTLTRKLLEAGRMDDLNLAMEDTTYRTQLYEEYQID